MTFRHHAHSIIFVIITINQEQQLQLCMGPGQPTFAARLDKRIAGKTPVPSSVQQRNDAASTVHTKTASKLIVQADYGAVVHASCR